MFRGPDGKSQSAGTFDSHERAIEVASLEEKHVSSLLSDTSPAEKATKTVREFGDERFLKFHDISPNSMQGYSYTLKNHIYPYIGHLRVSELNRETCYNLLKKVLPGEDGNDVAVTVVNATRKVLSALCQMAWNEGYRSDNPIRTIGLRHAGSKPVLVANHDRWALFEDSLRDHPAAHLHARLNVTTWARRCEMISLRPRDFHFPDRMLTISRSTTYLTAKFHPSGSAGWVTKDNPKYGDWRRFTISQQLCTSLREHIEEHSLEPDDLLFPQWMFAYRRITDRNAAEPDKLPPISTPTGVTHEHGTMGARYGLNCTCYHCRRFAADYQRAYRRKHSKTKTENGQRAKADTWRRDGTEFLSPEIWGRSWKRARTAAGLPQAFTPYNARHTGISWAIAGGIDLQKVRRRAGHGSLSVTSRYAAILDETDTTVADTFENIFNTFPT